MNPIVSLILHSVIIASAAGISWLAAHASGLVSDPEMAAIVAGGLAALAALLNKLAGNPVQARAKAMFRGPRR